jgi:membrane-associated phospholipid phosphatase
MIALLRANANFADGAYLAFFLMMSALILIRRRHVAGYRALLAVNLASCLAIVLLTLMSARSAFWRFGHDWYPVAMPIVTFEEVARLSFIFLSRWQDHHLLRLEARLFPVPPTVWLGRHGSSFLTELVEVGYFSYFVLLIIVAGTFYGRAQWSPFRQVVDASVLSYLFCYAVFLLFPTEGPAYTLRQQHSDPLPRGGPFHWTVLLIQKNAGVHGNAFPSAHVAGGVVALVFAWLYAWKLGMALTPLVFLLCVGAVYDRYHYLSDVIAGLIVGLLAAGFIH